MPFSAGRRLKMSGLQQKYSTMLPFEKCEAYGFESLTDRELLAVILRSGTRKCSCIDAAEQVIKLSGGGGVIGLQGLTVKELCGIPGIGKVKAIQLKSICELSRRMVRQTWKGRPVFRGTLDVVEYVMEDMRHLSQEQLRLLLLDRKGHLVHEKIMSIGTVSSTMMPAREVCREALLHDCCGMILVHNHPSGDPAPSRDDVISTGRIKGAGDLIGIPLIDHIIIGDNSYISMKDENIIEK